LIEWDAEGFAEFEFDCPQADMSAFILTFQVRKVSFRTDAFPPRRGHVACSFLLALSPSLSGLRSSWLSSCSFFFTFPLGAGGSDPHRKHPRRMNFSLNLNFFKFYFFLHFERRLRFMAESIRTGIIRTGSIRTG
jgi:hypothetical protein